MNANERRRAGGGRFIGGHLHKTLGADRRTRSPAYCRHHMPMISTWNKEKTQYINPQLVTCIRGW